jgi:hypothetical protein
MTTRSDRFEMNFIALAAFQWSDSSNEIVAELSRTDNSGQDHDRRELDVASEAMNASPKMRRMEPLISLLSSS